MEKQCRLTGEQFKVADLEIELYSRFGAEVPDLLPRERIRILSSFLNLRHFFRREQFTTHRADWGRSIAADIDPLSFGRELPRVQQFLEELLDLYNSVPRPALFGELEKAVGSTSIQLGDRLSYVSAGARVSLGTTSAFVRDSRGFCDSFSCSGLKDSYGCFNSNDLLRVAYAESSNGCSECRFIVNCVDCNHCLFCRDLNGASYQVGNRPVSREEFERILAELNLNTRGGLESALQRFFGLKEESVVSANPYSLQTTNSLNVWFSNNVTDCVDLFGYCEDLEESILSINCGGGRRLLGSQFCWGEVEELYYSAYCTKSRELIGCVGLEGRQYCILNRQYSESDYQALKSSIFESLKKKRSLGRPLNFKFSDYPYNATLAQDLFPLTKVQSALLEVRFDERLEQYQPSRLDLSRVSDLPQTVEEAQGSPDGIYLCELSGKPFQYFPLELELCSKLAICPSSYCYEERFRQMISRLRW
jgi:hypothetical protein